MMVMFNCFFRYLSYKLFLIKLILSEIYSNIAIYHYITISTNMASNSHLINHPNPQQHNSDTNYLPMSNFHQNAISPQQSHHEQSRESSHIHENDKTKAYIYALISNIIIPGVGFSVKRASYYFPSFLILGLRGGLLTIINYYVMRYHGVDFSIPDKKGFRLVMKRSIASALTMTMYLAPMQFLPIGIASTLFNTGPLMTFFIEALYYKQFKIKWIHFIITFICFCGIIMIIQPQFLFGQQRQVKYFDYLLYFVVLTAAFFSAFSMIFIYDLRRTVNEHAILQYGYLFQGTVSFILFMCFSQYFVNQIHYVGRPIDSVSQVLKFSLLLLMLIVSGFFTQYFRVISTQILKPSVLMPISYISVIIGMLIDVLMFDANYNILTVVGAFCTSCGLLIQIIAR